MKNSFIILGLVVFIGSLGVSSNIDAVFGSSAMSIEELSFDNLKNAIQEQDVPTIQTLISDKHNINVIPFLKDYAGQGHAWACYFLLKRLAAGSFSYGDPKTIIQGLSLVIMLEILTKMAEATVKKERSEELRLVWNDIFCNKVDQYFYSIHCQGVPIKVILEKNPVFYTRALDNVKERFTGSIKDYCTNLPYAYWVSTIKWAGSVFQGIAWDKPTPAQKTLFIDNLYEMASTDQERLAQKRIITEVRCAVYENVVSAFQRIVDDLQS